MMDEKTAAQLREPFPDNEVGKLPRAGIQLPYVGHAAVTNRLLKVDPTWSWVPMATDDHGIPIIVTQGLSPGTKMGLWIRMTVAGVERPGFGDGNTIKECISDAIRNSAMRFGVALDLWSKEELNPEGSGAANTSAKGTPEAGAAEAKTAAAPATNNGDKRDKQREGRHMWGLAKEVYGDEAEANLRDIVFKKTGQTSTGALTPQEYIDVIAQMEGEKVVADAPFE